MEEIHYVMVDRRERENRDKKESQIQRHRSREHTHRETERHNNFYLLKNHMAASGKNVPPNHCIKLCG